MKTNARKGLFSNSSLRTNPFTEPVAVTFAPLASADEAAAFGMTTAASAAKSGFGSGGNTSKGGIAAAPSADVLAALGDDGDAGLDIAAAAAKSGWGSEGNPAKGGLDARKGGVGSGSDGDNPAKGGADAPKGGEGVGQGGANPGMGHDGEGNPDRGPKNDGENPGKRPDDAGNPDNGNGDGTGDGEGKPDDAGNKGKGDGSGDGDGISDKPAPAPTPEDEPLLDAETVQYKSSYTFKVDDVTVGWDGERIGDEGGREKYLDSSVERVLKDGTILNPIDSEFGFYVTDFVGARDKVFDSDFGEGWVGELADGGIAVADARTDVFSTPARLGTWLQGIGGNTVKASTEHYSVMQAILSDQAYPGDDESYYSLDDDLWLVDYKVGGDGMPIGDDDLPSSKLVADDFHHFYVKELLDAMGMAAGQTEATADVTWIDFNRDKLEDAGEHFKAYMSDEDFDGFVRPVAVIDFIDNNDPEKPEENVDFKDGNLNGFGTFGLQDLMAPNESSILEDIAVGNDYSVTVKDDGKLLYRWGNAVKRPNDIRVDAKMDLPDEWNDDVAENGGAGDGFADKLYRVTAAELVVRHTVTNNPNDQIRPEDFENEAAIGILPDYVEVYDPDDATNVLWVADKGVYAGDGTFLPSYFSDTPTSRIVTTLAGEKLYANVDAAGNLIGTVFRDFSLIDKVMGVDGSLDPDDQAALIAQIGAVSEDLEEGFTEAYYTTMDREPFVADYTYDEDGNATGYVSGPRWRLQPDKYGQDLPSVVIPQDITDPPPIQNGEEKYESGVDTVTVLNLLDWDGTSPLTLSAGWMTGSGEVSDNGLNMTDQFDVAYYVKGDMKAVNLYGAELLMEYDEVTIHDEGVLIGGSLLADTLVGRGGNTFDMTDPNDTGPDGRADIAVIGYGQTTAAGLGENFVFNFSIEDGDAIGLIGFGLDPDNYNIHITQETMDTDADDVDDALLLALDGDHFATLYEVAQHLEADSFYFA